MTLNYTCKLISFLASLFLLLHQGIFLSAEESIYKKEELPKLNVDSLYEKLIKIERAFIISPVDNNAELGKTIKEMIDAREGKNTKYGEEVQEQLVIMADLQKKYIEKFGEFKGLDKIGAINLGNLYTSVGYIWKTEYAAIIFIYIFYSNGDDPWTLSSVRIHTMGDIINNPFKLNSFPWQIPLLPQP